MRGVGPSLNQEGLLLDAIKSLHYGTERLSGVRYCGKVLSNLKLLNLPFLRSIQAAFTAGAWKNDLGAAVVISKEISALKGKLEKIPETHKGRALLVEIKGEVILLHVVCSLLKDKGVGNADIIDSGLQLLNEELEKKIALSVKKVQGEVEHVRSICIRLLKKLGKLPIALADKTKVKEMVTQISGTLERFTGQTYKTSDGREIDPAKASNDDFEAFVQAAHDIAQRAKEVMGPIIEFVEKVEERVKLEKWMVKLVFNARFIGLEKSLGKWLQGMSTDNERLSKLLGEDSWSHHHVLLDAKGGYSPLGEAGRTPHRMPLLVRMDEILRLLHKGFLQMEIADEGEDELSLVFKKNTVVDAKFPGWDTYIPSLYEKTRLLLFKLIDEESG